VLADRLIIGGYAGIGIATAPPEAMTAEHRGG